MASKMMTSESMTDNISVEKFYYQRDKYNYQLLLQRGVVWSTYAKSKLITSLILNRPIPTLIVNKKLDGVLNFVDGVNRSASIIEFISGKYAIHEDIDNVTILILSTNEWREFEIRGKKFADFEQELQNHLLTRMLAVTICINLDENTEAEVLLNLNEGVPMSPIKKARVIGHESIQPFVTEISQNEFFERKIEMTQKVKNRSNHEQVIYNILSIELGIDDNISLGNPIKIVRHIKKNDLLTEDIAETIKDTIEYLDSCIPARHKFLKADNIIPVYMMAKQAMIDNIEPRDFFAIIEEFYANIPEAYTELKASGWINKKLVEDKTEILMDFYEEYVSRKDKTE